MLVVSSSVSAKKEIIGFYPKFFVTEKITVCQCHRTNRTGTCALQCTQPILHSILLADFLPFYFLQLENYVNSVGGCGKETIISTLEIWAWCTWKGLEEVESQTLFWNRLKTVL